MTWKRLSSEIEAHIEEKALDLIESGMPERDAWQKARREFGNATALTESSREVWGWTWLERLWQDIVYARRILTKSVGFTGIAVLSLALGVGANCAMFSLADTMLLRPLPVPRSGDVLSAGFISPQATAQTLRMSYPDYRDLREQSRSFSELAAFNLARVRFAKQLDAPVELRVGAVASGNFFAAMQVQPRLGRFFRPDEDEVPGRDAVMVLSHAFWEQQFGTDPSVLGRKVRVDGIDFTIVGVLAEEFTGADQWVRPDFYLPMMMSPRLGGGIQNPITRRDLRTFNVKGRLKAGVTLEQARAEAAVIGAALAKEYPETNRNYAVEIRSELQQRVEEGGRVPIVLAMMLVLAVAVLLVACANVAGLLTSRASARAREMSLRLAIGAGRGRLVRQLLTESMILALLGGLCGVAVGYGGVQIMKQIQVVADVPVALSFRLDERVLLYSLVAAMGSVFLFGLLPAMRTTRADLTGALRMGNSRSISQSGRPRLWTRNMLVVGQVALSMVLLTVATVMYLTFRRDLLAGPGFRADHVLMTTLDPSLVNYSDAQTRNLYKDLPERARTIPGVRSAALASGVPGGFTFESMAVVPENYEVTEGQRSLNIMGTRIDKNYFATLRVPIVQGRGFAVTDDANSRLVAVVNETAAEQYWPGQNPIGKRTRLGDAGSPWLEIIGVAKTGKYRFLMERPTPFLYIPFAQHPKAQMVLLLESAGDPASLAAPLRDIMRDLDPDLPTFGTRTLQQTFETGAVDPNLLIVQMSAAMGSMGVLLALSGLYGLIAFSVSTRRREIGIRMAVGAHKNNVLGMVLRQGLVLAGTGTVVGLFLSAGTARLLSAAFPSYEYSVVVYLIVVPAAFGVTMLAAFLPALRAAQVNPVLALRQD